MSAASGKRLVILLHGVGSNGADMMGLAQLWRPILPGVSFEAPNAPERFDHGGGFQWFSIDGVTQSNRESRIVMAREGFDRVVAACVANHGLQDHLDRVAIVGFSQGTIMAVEAVVSGRWPVAGLVGFSGRLVSSRPFSSKTSTPILLLHGANDQVIPAAETTNMAKELMANGFKVESHIYPGLAHGISSEGAARAAEFLASKLSQSPP
jgi:phospholipase/carboxylesterase